MGEQKAFCHFFSYKISAVKSIENQKFKRFLMLLNRKILKTFLPKYLEGKEKVPTFALANQNYGTRRLADKHSIFERIS